MAGVEAVKKKNLESSILFMQQEHTTTLKGLHSEIQKLQQRCSELTFQLAMEQTSTPQETLYKEKVSELKEQDASAKSLREQVKKKDIRIQNLEQQIKALDRKYKDELKHKQQNIVKLEGELREKCTELAGLRMTVLTARTAAVTAQRNVVGAASVKETSKSIAGPDLSSSNRITTSSSPRDSMPSRESSFSGQGSLDDDYEKTFLSSRNPVPPMNTLAGKGSRNFRRSRHIREPLSEVIPRPASGRKLEVKSYSQQDPDNQEILEIVAQQKKSLDLRHGPEPVVPPIPHSANKKLSPRSANSAAFAKRVRARVNPPEKRRENSSSPDIEVETLAVGQVINSDLRKAHEFNSFGTDA